MAIGSQRPLSSSTPNMRGMEGPASCSHGKFQWAYYQEYKLSRACNCW